MSSEMIKKTDNNSVKNMHIILIEATSIKINKLYFKPLMDFAESLEISLTEDTSKNKNKKKLMNETISKIKTLSNEDIMKIIKKLEIQIPVKKKNMHNILIEATCKKIKTLYKKPLMDLAESLEISLTEYTSKNKNKEKLINETISKIKTLSNEDIMKIIKKKKLEILIPVKKLLELKIDIDYLISLDICLTLDKFLSENALDNKFNETCDLVNENNSIKSKNCHPEKIQGLYILTISKNDNDYIIKLGSFAESQGMYNRIISFGGGNYNTGSATNKWFQQFVKKAMKEGYTSKFTYYNKHQDKIKIKNLDDEEIEIIPYVVRSLETELFKKYNFTNNNISPIFGSNCL